MRFRAEQDVDGEVADVEATLIDPEFYASLGDLTKIGAPEVVDTSRRADEVVQRVRYRFVADLPGAVTAVVDRDKLTWIEEARYDLTAHTSTHTILPDHYADRLQGEYSCSLVADGERTRRTVTGEITVHVALVHKRVEQVIVDGLVEFAAEQAQSLDRWLRERR